ncbi:hypothetical protein HK100_000544 [Physocladia obscura]|uniref:Uncharacterized protein n=1 Tax=Physocladia obscura TaxID=109957 RepID=A0AAD5XJU7_9FUNG|nr:hypothetical protein HK100_000544 [Physocladia obscura]
MPNSGSWKFSIPSITDWIDPDPGSAATDYSSSTQVQAEWYFDPCFLGDYGSTIKSLYPLPTFTTAEQTLMKGSCDFIAVNMYNSITAGLSDEPPGETTPYTAQEVDDPTALVYWPNPRPEGTRLLPLYLYNRYQKEVVITEMGYHVPREVENTFEEAVNDTLRVEYWQLNGPQILALIQEDKVPVTAVLAWSLIDNYEFETYEFRWGHIAVDYWDPATGLMNTDKGSLKREVKLSALYMSEFFGNYTTSPFNNTIQKNSTASTTLTASGTIGSNSVTSTSVKSRATGSSILRAASLGLLGVLTLL